MNATITADRVHSKALPELAVKLLTARQESLVLYHKLAALKPRARLEPVQRPQLDAASHGRGEGSRHG